PDGHLGMPHVPRHAHTGKNTRGVRRGADRSGGTMEHRTVRAFAAAEMMTLHQARESTALADADYIHHVLRFELIHADLIAGLEIVVPGTEAEFAHETRAADTRFFQMSGRGLVQALFLDVLHQAQLNGVITVGGRSLTLHDH